MKTETFLMNERLFLKKVSFYCSYYMTPYTNYQ